MPFKMIARNPRHASVAERVAELAEAGDLKAALELLAVEGDPAAQADAAAQAVTGQRRFARVGVLGVFAALALAVPSVALAASATSSQVSQAKAWVLREYRAGVPNNPGDDLAKGITASCRRGQSSTVTCVVHEVPLSGIGPLKVISTVEVSFKSGSLTLVHESAQPSQGV